MHFTEDVKLSTPSDTLEFYPMLEDSGTVTQNCA